MIKEKSADILKRIIKISLVSQAVLVCLIFFFTKRIIYSIIFLFAAILGILWFMFMIRLIDRILYKRKGRVLFFAAGFLKMIVITATFYAVSRISEAAVLFYMLGLSMIIISILLEGVYQVSRRNPDGRA
ncbi:MAG: hypothetical protein L0Y73_01245 [Candidatus Aminicenantes bacterium]|nr:hypothetical protein [Candidatus Aminicenantes bacterium]